MSRCFSITFHEYYNSAINPETSTVSGQKKKKIITPLSQKESVSHHTIPQQSRNLQRPPGELCCVTALHSRALTPSFQWCVCEADQSKHRGPNMSLLTKSKMAAITVQGGEKKTNPKSSTLSEPRLQTLQDSPVSDSSRGLTRK